MTTPEKFNIGLLSDGQVFIQLAQQLFRASLLDFKKIGQGFYAHVYSVSLDQPPHQIVCKCYHHSGRALAEERQLQVLRKHSIVKMPEVYSHFLYSQDMPCDVLVMEHLPGVNAAKVQFPNETTQTAFVDKTVEILEAWHSVHNPDGFGDIDGPMLPTWAEALGGKVKTWQVQAHTHCDVISPYVLGVIDRSAALVGTIFADRCVQASLVHSDYNAWNIMVDPETCQITGVIDPIDAGWADPEIDLFHLPNCRPELGLLQRYLRHRNVDERFWMRFSFYRFWDDVKHFLRMGWYSEERFGKYARELESHLGFNL